MTQRITYFFKYDSQNCDLIELFFLWFDSKTELFKWLKELNPLCEFDSRRELFFRYAYKNWTLFSNISLQELNFVRKRHKELNVFFFFEEIWLKELICQKNWLKDFWIFFHMTKELTVTRRIESFLLKFGKNRTNWIFFRKKEMTQRIELSFWNMSERIKLLLRETWLEDFFWTKSRKLLNLFLWLKELNFLRTWLTELNHFWKMIHKF